MREEYQIRNEKLYYDEHSYIQFRIFAIDIRGHNSKLYALEIDFWRRAARKSKLEQIRNGGIGRTLVEDIKIQQLIWQRHVTRMEQERLPKLMLKWIPLEIENATDEVELGYLGLLKRCPIDLVEYE